MKTTEKNMKIYTFDVDYADIYLNDSQNSKIRTMYKKYTCKIIQNSKIRTIYKLSFLFRTLIRYFFSIYMNLGKKLFDV